MTQADPPLRNDPPAPTGNAPIETLADDAVLSAIVAGQRAAIDACQAAIPGFAAATASLVEVWRNGGCIGYCGAGSSGLIALLDGLELPCTFGLDASRIPFLIAGGVGPFAALDQEAEDDADGAETAVRAAGLGAADVLIAVSASGRTPFTVAAARAARDRGARIVGIACVANAPLLDLATIAIALPTRPEVVAGSTRLNAGTATKCALNMVSTLLGMRLGHVFAGRMVNLKPENAKLRDRAAGIVADVTGVTRDAAAGLLEETGMAVKPAILMAKGATRSEALALVEAFAGDLGSALERLAADALPDPGP